MLCPSQRGPRAAMRMSSRRQLDVRSMSLQDDESHPVGASGPHTLSQPKVARPRSSAMAREALCPAAPGHKTPLLLVRAQHRCRQSGTCEPRGLLLARFPPPPDHHFQRQNLKKTLAGVFRFLGETNHHFSYWVLQKQRTPVAFRKMQDALTQITRTFKLHLCPPSACPPCRARRPRAAETVVNAHGQCDGGNIRTWHSRAWPEGTTSGLGCDQERSEGHASSNTGKLRQQLLNTEEVTQTGPRDETRSCKVDLTPTQAHTLTHTRPPINTCPPTLAPPTRVRPTFLHTQHSRRDVLSSHPG